MTLKELIIDWLTESRYCRSLETRCAELRQDYTERLAEKDAQIKGLKTELAGLKLENDRMKAVLLPLGSAAGRMYAELYQGELKPPLVPAFDGPEDWQGELHKMIETEEQADGLRGSGREEVHQPGAHDGAQAVA